jgi:hypothetical protein
MLVELMKQAQIKTSSIPDVLKVTMELNLVNLVGSGD